MSTNCRDACGERLADVSHGRQLDESPIEFLEAGAPGGGALTGGRPLRPGAVFRGASLLELDATPCHACLRGSVVGLDAVHLRLGGIESRAQLLGLEQRFGGRGSGGLLRQRPLPRALP